MKTHGSGKQELNDSSAVDWAFDQRSRLVSGTTTLNNSTATLGITMEVTTEIELIGINILADLREQREVLERADSGVIYCSLSFLSLKN